jgi:hypothetical protein
MTDVAAAVDYRAAAIKKFKPLVSGYNGKEIWLWKLGNTLDTMIDFLDTIDASDANNIADIVDKQFPIAAERIGWDKIWFDDFGWWSVATGHALQKPFFNSDSKKKLKVRFDQCWSRFHENAPFVWQRHQSGTFDGYRPAFDGGVWQTYFDGTPAEYHGPREDPGDPPGGDLPDQNTVTNALFLMAAQRNSASDWAKIELKFLDTWLREKKESLWCALDDNAALVRERVGHFADGKRTPHFQDDWFWTGDQGLMLGNFSDVSPDNGGEYRKRIQHLLVGVQQRLVDDAGVLRNYSKSGNVPGGDIDDYQTGSGVFWRNALHVWNTRSDLRIYLQVDKFQAMLRASANAAAQSSDQRFDMLSNQIAVLLAAVAMLK